MFITTLFSNPAMYFLLLVGVIFSICVHEMSHAYIAYQQGDSTAVDQGHLTLNPMIQMGPMSLLLCAVIGVAWGAVPVNPHRMRHRWSHAWVSFAGPLVNLILFVLFSLLLGLLLRNEASDLFVNFAFMTATINIVLFLLNMLPVPPFDGNTVFGYFFPQLERIHEEVRNGAMFIVVIAFFMLSGQIFAFAGMMSMTVASLVHILG